MFLLFLSLSYLVCLTQYFYVHKQILTPWGRVFININVVLLSCLVCSTQYFYVRKQIRTPWGRVYINIHVVPHLKWMEIWVPTWDFHIICMFEKIGLWYESIILRKMVITIQSKDVVPYRTIMFTSCTYMRINVYSIK